MAWRDRDWAKVDSVEPDDFLTHSRFARRRSRTIRGFAIGMLLLFAVIALAGLLRL
jgi:hypothetical protein